MSDQYYNTYLYDKILRIQQFDLYGSVKMIEDYCRIYPNDYCAALLYCITLIKINEVDKAESIINDIENKYYYEKRRLEKDEKFEKKLILAKIRLYCYQSKYEEVIEVVKKYSSILCEFKLGTILTYCYQKLGKNHYTRNDNNNYLSNQISKYSKDDFRNHIKQHMIDSECDIDEEKIRAVFFSDFPMDKILDEIYHLVPNDKNKLCLGYYDNSYFFKYDNCGKCGDNISDYRRSKGSYAISKITDYFKIVTFKDTNEIITMYPCLIGKHLPIIDLNYLKDEKCKIKKKSALDKFNERYKNWGC